MLSSFVAGSSGEPDSPRARRSNRNHQPLLEPSMTNHQSILESLARHTLQLAVLLLPVTAAHAQDANGVAKRLRATFPGMPAAARVEATIVPGIFAMRVSSFPGCPVYVDANVTIIANNGNRGWFDISSNQPLDEARSRQ